MTLALLTTLMVNLALFCLMASSFISFGTLALTLAMFLSITLALFFTPWLGMVTFLIFIGGLMVMFAYFLAICPNQHSSTNKRMIVLTILSGLLISLFLWNNHLLTPTSPPMSLHTLYYDPLLFLFLGSFLFFTLIVIVKLVELNQGPLRPFKCR
nr:NADH dehydrogenase subunit 6 [Notomastus sp. GK-2021]